MTVEEASNGLAFKFPVQSERSKGIRDVAIISVDHSLAGSPQKGRWICRTLTFYSDFLLISFGVIGNPIGCTSGILRTVE